MRERMRNYYRHRGFHYFLPAGVFNLDQVNQLRAALGLPPQAGDPGGQQIDDFHQSVRSQRPLATQGLIAACVAVYLVKAYFDGTLLGGDLKSDIAWAPIARRSPWGASGGGC